MPLSGIPVGMVVIGGVLVWSGIENEPVTAIFQALATGKMPPKGPVDPPGFYATPGTGSGSSTAQFPASDSAIANDAMKYQGHCYQFGGAPGPDGTGCWDCSSFVNWVLGHDLGLAIPGYKPGTYNGQSHGPATTQYLVFGSAVSAASVQAGDLVVGITHMGIATGGGNYISAHDPAEGTSVSPISSFPDPVIFYRRITAVPDVPGLLQGAGP